VKYFSICPVPHMLEGHKSLLLVAQFIEGHIDHYRKSGKEIILDNGAYEFGEAMDSRQYLDIIRALQPDYYVIPDVFGKGYQTSERTFDFIFNDLKEYKEKYPEDFKKPKAIAVAWASNLREFVDIIDEYESCKAIHTIAIPKKLMYNPRHSTRAALSFGNYGHKPWHFLGCNDVYEIQYCNRNVVKSFDSSYPFKLSKHFSTDKLNEHGIDVHMPDTAMPGFNWVDDKWTADKDEFYAKFMKACKVDE